MSIHLVAVCCEISIATAQSVLFIREEHDTESASRAKPQALDQANGLDGLAAAASIVVCSLPHVPSIEVASYHEDLLRVFSADEFTDDVVTLGLWQSAAVLSQVEHNSLA